MLPNALLCSSRFTVTRNHWELMRLIFRDRHLSKFRLSDKFWHSFTFLNFLPVAWLSRRRFCVCCFRSSSKPPVVSLSEEDEYDIEIYFRHWYLFLFSLLCGPFNCLLALLSFSFAIIPYFLNTAELKKIKYDRGNVKKKSDPLGNCTHRLTAQRNLS